MTKKRLAKRATQPVSLQQSAGQIARIKAALPDLRKPYFPQGVKILPKKQVDFLKESVSLADSMLDAGRSSANERLLCVLARWYCLDTLFMNAYNSHTVKGTDISGMYQYKSALDKHRDTLWTTLCGYSTQPDVLDANSRKHLYQSIGNYAQTYFRIPALTGYALTLNTSKSPGLWLEIQAHYHDAMQRKKQIEALIKTMTEQAETNRAIESLSRPSLLNAEQNTLTQQLQVAIDNVDYLLIKVGVDLVNAGYAPVTDSSTGTSNDAQEPVLSLQMERDSHTISMQYLKLMTRIRDNPGVFDSNESQRVIFDWISHPDRLKYLPIALSQFISTNTREEPKSIQKNTDNLWSWDEKIDTLERLGQCNHVVIFFYRLFQNASSLEQVSIRNLLLYFAWEYQLSALPLIDNHDRHKITPENFLWYKHNLENYFRQFELIIEPLTAFLRAIHLRQYVPGINPDSIHFYQKNMDTFLAEAIKIQYQSLLDKIYKNTLETSELAIRTIDTLLTLLDMVTLGGLQKRPGSRAYRPLESVAGVRQYVSVLPYVLKHSSNASFAASQTLHLNEGALLQALSAPATIGVDDANQEAVFNRYDRLYESLYKQLSQNSDLTSAITELTQCLPELLANGFSDATEGRIQILRKLDMILQLCLSAVDDRLIPELLLANQIKIYSGHIDAAVQRCIVSIKQQEGIKTARVFAILNTPHSDQDLEKTESGLAQFDEDFQRLSFNFSLVNELKSSARQPDLIRLCQLLQHIAPIPEAKQLRDTLFHHLVRRIMNECQHYPLDYSKRIHNSLNAVLNSIPNVSECLPEEDLKQKKLASLIAFCLREPYLWHAEGEIERARSSLNNINSRLQRLKTALDPDTYADVLELAVTCDRVINMPDTFPCLLAFLRRPFVPETGIPDYLPPEKDLKTDECQSLQRFQNAWYALSANAGKVHTPQEARTIFRVWKEEFSRSCTDLVTRNMLLKLWSEHYTHCCRQWNVIAVSPSPSSTGHERQTATPPKRTQEDHQRLRAIEAYNQKSMEKCLTPKPAKVAAGGKKTIKKPKAVTTESAATGSLNLVSVTVPSHPLPYGYRNPLLVQLILDKLTEAGYLAFLTGGYVRDTLIGLPPNDADILTNCPPEALRTLFPQLVENGHHSGVFHGRDENLVVDITCRKGSSIEEMTAAGDFTVNALAITKDNRLYVASGHYLDHISAKTLQTIVPFDESMSVDPSRMWRLVRLSNQLKWPLNPDLGEAITRNAHKLADVPFTLFMKNVRKCFLSNRALPSDNLKTLLDLHLLPFIFQSNPTARALDSGLRTFIESTCWQILDGYGGYRQVDLLALFALSLQEKIEVTRNIVRQWVDNTHDPLLTSQLCRRVEYFYARSPLARLSPLAAEYDPTLMATVNAGCLAPDDTMISLLSSLLFQTGNVTHGDTLPALHYFLLRFRTCFLSNWSLAHNNLEKALDMNLLPLFFQDEPRPPVIKEATQMFIREHFASMFRARNETQLIDMLALFSLSLESSLPKTIAIMHHWLLTMSFAPERNKPYAGHLQDGLADRIRHVFSLARSAGLGTPTEASTSFGRFFNRKSSPYCKAIQPITLRAEPDQSHSEAPDPAMSC